MRYLSHGAFKDHRKREVVFALNLKWWIRVIVKLTGKLSPGGSPAGQDPLLTRLPPASTFMGEASCSGLAAFSGGPSINQSGLYLLLASGSQEFWEFKIGIETSQGEVGGVAQPSFFVLFLALAACSSSSPKNPILQPGSVRTRAPITKCSNRARMRSFGSWVALGQEERAVTSACVHRL